MQSMNVGYPDGDSRPSVTMDYRRTYTMKPDSNGVVSFGIGTGYLGCFIKGRGVLSTNVPFTPMGIEGTGAFAAGPAVTSAVAATTGLIPIVDSATYNARLFPAYRPIVAVAEVAFTGSTMQNGGAVTIAKTSTASSINRTFGSSIEVPCYQHREPEPAMTGSAVVGPARDTYVSRVVPADPEFQPVQWAATTSVGNSATLVTNGVISAGFTTNDRKVYSMPCQQAGAVWYEYSGLDATASITVNVRYCVQYSVSGNSPFVPIAHPSPAPPANPSLLSRMFSAVTSSPAALQFAANAVGSVLPATRPLLAIAADAYNHG